MSWKNFGILMLFFLSAFLAAHLAALVYHGLAYLLTYHLWPPVKYP